METDDNSLEGSYISSADDSSLESPQPTIATIEPSAGMPPPTLSPQTRKSFKLGKKLIAVGALVAIAAVAVVAGLLLLSSSSPKQSASGNAASNFAVTNLSTAGVQDVDQLQIGESDHLAINGQLQVSNTVVLTPTAAPSSPTAGQIYYGQDNQLYLYNGTRFINLSANSGGLTSNQVSVSLQTGAGLAKLANNVLVNTGVLSVQGQSGALTFSGGNGIAINGFQVSNTGVTGLSGTADQITVSQSHGDAQLSLPQNIDPTASPTFGGLTLTGATPDGVLYAGTGSSPIGSAVAGAAGLCLMSTSGAPAFGACSSATISGTPGQLALFTGSGNSLGDSLIAQSGSAISVNGDLSVTGTISGDGSGLTDLDASNVTSGVLPITFGGTGASDANDARTNLEAAQSGINSDITSLTGLSSITPASALTIGAAGVPLTLQGSGSTTIAATSAGSTTTLSFATPATTADITLPNTSGTVAVQADGPLALDATGTLTCATCLVSGGGGGVAGVVSGGGGGCGHSVAGLSAGC